jgi:hypothetical protein
VRRNYSAMLDEIEEGGDLTDEIVEELRASIENYHLTCQA